MPNNVQFFIFVFLNLMLLFSAYILGDTDRYATKLPNKVYNKLRVHSMAEGKRSARLHEKKDQSTATQAVDQKTRLLLFKMLNVGLLEEVHGVISVGKYVRSIWLVASCLWVSDSTFAI